MTAVEHAADERVLRADAQRNRDRILAAAREVFAREGLEASVAEVAERAGVGTATIFRRFPTKEALLAAVVEEHVEEIVATARRAAESRNPGKALREVMAWGIESTIHDRCFCELAGSAVFDQPRLHELTEEIDAAVEQLLSRAKEAGQVRRDVTATDISTLVLAVASATQKLDPSAQDGWSRYLDIVLAGLRPPPRR